MMDVAGTELAEEEAAALRHPLVGGVILFTRNYADREQLRRLTEAIHALRSPPLLIAVDHEGGRVQRFRTGFTALPPMRALGRLWDADAAAARAAAEATGYVLAAELRACGVDLSFAPVLDLDHGPSGVIGDRAFHREPLAVIEMAGALIQGMGAAGMIGVGKHFPGHGFVSADSHLAIPVDNRSYQAIAEDDLLPYGRLAKVLGGVMPAHIVYDQVDRLPAGYSRSWLQVVLRQRLGFQGVVFSDDLSMEGASFAGGVVDRARAAMAAGCDMVLLCNDPVSARLLLAEWRPDAEGDPAQRIARLVPRKPGTSWDALQKDPAYGEALRAMKGIPRLEVKGDGCSPPPA
jgi:beta-N-acetylhexosaminidase